MVSGRARQKLYGAPPQRVIQKHRRDWDNTPIQANGVLPKPKRWLRTPLMGAYVTQTSSTVDRLRFGCPQNHPLGAELAQKGHIRDEAPALRDPSKMLDMVPSSHVLR